MKLIKVRALEAYEKNKVSDEVLGRIPKAGETFEVDEKRLKKLLGENAYKTTFVEIVEEETKAAATKGKGKGKEDAAKEETKAAATDNDGADANEDDNANANGDNEGDK